jgi:hypothetical protein
MPDVGAAGLEKPSVTAPRRAPKIVCIGWVNSWGVLSINQKAVVLTTLFGLNVVSFLFGGTLAILLVTLPSIGVAVGVLTQ